MFEEIVITSLLICDLLITGCATQQKPTLKTSFNRKALESTSNKSAMNAIQDLRKDLKRLRTARKLSKKSYNSMMKNLTIMEIRLNTLVDSNQSLRKKGFKWSP